MCFKPLYKIIILMMASTAYSLNFTSLFQDPPRTMVFIKMVMGYWPRGINMMPVGSSSQVDSWHSALALTKTQRKIFLGRSSEIKLGISCLLFGMNAHANAYPLPHMHAD